MRFFWKNLKNSKTHLILTGSCGQTVVPLRYPAESWICFGDNYHKCDSCQTFGKMWPIRNLKPGDSRRSIDELAKRDLWSLPLFVRFILLRTLFKFYGKPDDFTLIFLSSWKLQDSGNYNCQLLITVAILIMATISGVYEL